jgi:hypothetical protein
MVRGAAWSDGGDGVPVPYLVCGATWPDDVDSVPVPYLVRGAARSDDGDGVPVPTWSVVPPGLMTVTVSLSSTVLRSLCWFCLVLYVAADRDIALISWRREYL